MNYDIKDVVEKLNASDPKSRPGDILAEKVNAGQTGEIIIDSYAKFGNDRTRAFHHVNLSDEKQTGYYNGMNVILVKDFPYIKTDNIDTADIEKRLVELAPDIRLYGENPPAEIAKKFDQLGQDLGQLRDHSPEAYQKFLILYSVMSIEPLSTAIRTSLENTSKKDMLKNWFQPGFNMDQAYNLMAHKNPARSVHVKAYLFREPFEGWVWLRNNDKNSGTSDFKMNTTPDQGKGGEGLPLKKLTEKLSGFNFKETSTEEGLKDVVTRLANGEKVPLTSLNNVKIQTVDAFIDGEKRNISLVDDSGKMQSHAQYRHPAAPKEISPEQQRQEAAKNSFLTRIPPPKATPGEADDGGKKKLNSGGPRR